MQIKKPQDISDVIKNFVKQVKDPVVLAACHTFMSDFEVVITDDKSLCATACITGSKKLIFNKEFLEQDVKNEEELFFVFLHEIHHQINGDLNPVFEYDYMPGYHIYNIIYDIRINAHIMSVYTKAAHTFTSRFYKGRNMASALLKPWFEEEHRSEVFNNGVMQKKAVEVMMKSMRGAVKGKKLREAFAKLYLDAWFGTGGINSLVKRAADIFNDYELNKAMLIGTHSNGGVLGKGVIKAAPILNRDKDNRAAVFEAAKAALVEGGAREGHMNVQSVERGLIPVYGRREIFMQAGGFYPWFFSNTLIKEAMKECRVHLYLDVSGSMSSKLDMLTGLLASVKNYIADSAWSFSGHVEKLPSSGITCGIFSTTWSTDVEKVLKHAIENSHEKVLIASDGDVLSKSSREAFEDAANAGIKVFLIVMNSGRLSRKGDLSSLKGVEKVWLIRDNENLND